MSTVLLANRNRASESDDQLIGRRVIVGNRCRAAQIANIKVDGIEPQFAKLLADGSKLNRGRPGNGALLKIGRHVEFQMQNIHVAWRGIVASGRLLSLRSEGRQEMVLGTEAADMLLVVLCAGSGSNAV